MMEARSLSSLNTLASNPPQYPINPAEEKAEPLVLYISRVPGTRDVILSPFKPQDKNVTGEDVASSLYYVHLEIGHADLSGPAPIQDDGFRSSSDESPTSRSIPRKPLPASARPMTPEATPNRDRLAVPMNEPSRPRGLSLNDAYDTPRSKVQWSREDSGLALNDISPEPKSRPIPDLRPPLPRRPLGPRPMSSPGVANQLPPPPPAGFDKALPPLPLQAGGSQGAMPPPPLHIDSSQGIVSPEPLRPVRRDRPTSRSPSPRKFSDPTNSTPFTLTLIRRDPSTGNQWNVGRISSYQMETNRPDPDGTVGFPPVVSAAPPPAASAQPPINLQIETLGYAKFRHMPAKRSLDAGATPKDVKNAMANMSMRDNGAVRNDGVTFSRQVVMAYSKSWTSNLKDKWHQLEQSRQGHGRGQARNSSIGSVESVGSTGSNEDAPELVTRPGPGLKPRGYIFSSPWDGRCEFRTGNGGRSVRCYHTLHDETSSSFNPLVSGPGSSNTTQGGGAMHVSELRFNLPNTEIFKTPEGRREAKAQLQGHFNKFFKGDRPGYESEDDDGIISPFDMNLGREKAGGGNRGKRAKLGKLIIYNDGLKMLDLVVAANIGVWWGAWEKSF